MYVYLIIDKHEKVVKDLKDFSFIMYTVHLQASLPLSALPTIYSIVIFSEQVIPTGKNKKKRELCQKVMTSAQVVKMSVTATNEALLG